MSRVTWLVVAALLGAACASASVESERADRIAPQPADTVPDDGASTTAPAELDQPTEPDEPDDEPEARPTREASTSAGDPLFPELGSSDVDVLTYDVRLDIGDAEIRGDVVVEAAVPLEVSQLALDAVGLTVSSVTVDGEAAVFEQLDAELLIELPIGRAERVTAVVEYSASPRPIRSSDLSAGWFDVPGGSYVLNEPDGARTWLPSNDHPSDKALWRFQLGVPAGTVAVANGELEQRGDGTRPWVWSQTQPMSTYLVQLIVGDYVLVEDEPYVSVDGDEIELLHVAPPDLVDRFQPYFDLTGVQLDFFEEWFGPYPLDRYGLAFVSGFPPGLAMETQGRSMFGPDNFGGGEPGFGQHLLLAHEIAHQWFGNAVSPAEWDDIWLNESFASYAQWMWLDEVGQASVDDLAGASLRGRQGGGAATGLPTASTMFGFESYDGGAVVLHALRATIGDDAFFELLQRWAAVNVGTSRSTADFIDLAEMVTGTDLTVFFDDWLFATDLPDEFPG